jgi:hypothetical protein
MNTVMDLPILLKCLLYSTHDRGRAGHLLAQAEDVMAGPKLEIPVAGMQHTIQHLATFQTRDFHFNIALKK